mmetsp:Transcript_33174/g.48699  ORF Transcript_33174/g.48699 Transcript_33174/m.48699 type:complete len:261 (-) Transcript_33174:2217-2999(-)
MNTSRAKCHKLDHLYMPQYYQRKAMGRATRAQLPLLLLATMCALRNSVALAGGSGNGSGTAGINTGIRTYTSKNNVLVSGGLVNLGNTCYLNAQLQCAYHVPLVRELILNGPPPKPAPPKPAPVSPANPQTDEDDAITEAEDVAKDDNEEKTEITEEEEEEEEGERSRCNWIVIGTHVEKVKSFAPRVHHYVADIFVGPTLPHSLLHKNIDLKESKVGMILESEGRLSFVPSPGMVDPPSCALDKDGVLNQEWMMCREEK